MMSSAERALCQHYRWEDIMRYVYGAIGVIAVAVIVFGGLVALQRMLG
jgi:hypothetical protein